MATEQLQRPDNFWLPNDEYYERVAESNVNSTMHWIGRIGTSIASFYETGRVIVDKSPGFIAMQPEIAEGNTITIAPHFGKFETVGHPEAQERAGIHHARPWTKVEMYQTPIERVTMDNLGAIAIDKNGEADMAGLFSASAGILKRGDNNPGAKHGLLRRKVKNGSLMVFPGGTRNKSDVMTAPETKIGVVKAGLLNDSLMIPSAFIGRSVEVSDEGEILRRDKKSKFGLGPRAVVSFCDPFRFEPLSVPLNTDGTMSDSTTDSATQRRELMERNDLVRESLQKAIDQAKTRRGTWLEEDFTSL